MSNKFACIILSHGRADRVKTYNTLRNHGYTGDIYILCDNEDSQLAEYKRLYGDQVVVFDKDEYIKRSDRFTNRDIRNVVVYARNACFDVAKNLGLTHFLMLDDDYTRFSIRYEQNNQLKQTNANDLDADFKEFLTFLDNSNAHAVCYAQNGDYIGGLNALVFKKVLTRKAMNAFFCRVDRPFEFFGFLNEDVNAYTVHGNRGILFFTVGSLAIEQTPTQKQAGGLTEAYLDNGTYVKSFNSVLCSPNCVKIATLKGETSQYENTERLHHQVTWNNCTPMILNEKWKKYVS